VSADAQDVLGDRVAAHSVRALREVPSLLDAEEPDGSAFLDLIGHTTRPHRLLRLGGDVIDMFDPAIAAFFAELASSRVLARLDVVGVRLLGCETAATPVGRRTLAQLARTLGVPVLGVRKPLLKSHWSASGFDPAFGHLLR